MEGEMLGGAVNKRRSEVTFVAEQSMQHAVAAQSCCACQGGLNGMRARVNLRNDITARIGV